MLTPLNSSFTKRSERKIQLGHSNTSGFWFSTCPVRSFNVQEWWQLRWKMLTHQIWALSYLDFNTMVGTCPSPCPQFKLFQSKCATQFVYWLLSCHKSTVYKNKTKQTQFLFPYLKDSLTDFWFRFFIFTSNIYNLISNQLILLTVRTGVIV